jgi:hypothetical protein
MLIDGFSSVSNNIETPESQNNITVMEYPAEDDSDSSIEGKEEVYSSSDDEDQEVTIVKKK